MPGMAVTVEVSNGSRTMLSYPLSLLKYPYDSLIACASDSFLGPTLHCRFSPAAGWNKQPQVSTSAAIFAMA